MENNKIMQAVEDRFERDFNFIPLPLLEKAYPNGELLEAIIYPDNHDFEREEEPLYPMWNTLFEAKDMMMNNFLKEHVNELDNIGIHLMQVDETYTMMFIMGAGYNFYQFHWIPLYKNILKWVN